MRSSTSFPLGVGFLSSTLAVCFAVASFPSASAATSAFPTELVFDEFRSYDGTGNNSDNPSWGSAGTALLRNLVPADYEDGIAEPRDEGLPGARQISNAFAARTAEDVTSKLVTDFFWQWGQFLDHDIDLTGTAYPAESFDIVVPVGDRHFDPDGSGGKVIPLHRSAYVDAPGTRQQVNQITAFIDASNVYGSDAVRASELRSLDGTGRLKTTAGELLPFNVNQFPNAPTSKDPSFFLAGDERANEQAALTAMHTLFVREHNYQADRIRTENPELDGEAIYQRARAIVAAEMQAVTYREFLPLLLGADALPPYEGYDSTVEPGIENSFSTVVYRFGHSMVSSQLLQLSPMGEPMRQGPFPLRDVFFAPELILDIGIDPLLRGLAAQPARRIDPFVVDDVRNFLFGDPSNGGLDLFALNIQRGRDHGMPRYNELRMALGLEPCGSLGAICSDPVVDVAFAEAYDGVDHVDGWIGSIAEDKYEDALVGETIFHVLRHQFLSLRDGDRFWYERYLSPEWIDYVESQTLAVIIRRNTQIHEIQDNVFVVPSTTDVAAGSVQSSTPSVLGRPFPNPSRGDVSFDLDLASASPGRVVVEILDARGRRLRVLNREPMDVGSHQLIWDRRDDRGNRVPAGFYFVRASGDFGVDGQKLVLID